MGLGRRVLAVSAVEPAVDKPEITAVGQIRSDVGRSWHHCLAKVYRRKFDMVHPRVSPHQANLTRFGPLVVPIVTRGIAGPGTRLLISMAKTSGLDEQYDSGVNSIHTTVTLPTPKVRAKRRAIFQALPVALEPKP